MAYVYTKSLASKYLSRWLQQRLIPFQCFKLACERLFGSVECVAKPSRDVITEHVWKGRIKEKDLVLEQVISLYSRGFNLLELTSFSIFCNSAAQAVFLCEYASILFTLMVRNRYS